MILALVNNKGGVGKTTSTVNIGVGLANKGKKVLLIDLDQQASLTTSLGVNLESIEHKNISHLLLKELKTKDVIIKFDKIDLVPSFITLMGVELTINGVMGRENILKNKLKEVSKEYDYILIDCPPSMNILSVNALVASSSILIPIECEYLALCGTKQLLEIVGQVREELNPTLGLLGLFLTKYDQRKTLNKNVLNSIQEAFEEYLFESVINTNVRLAEAPSHKKDIFSYDIKSSGARDYEKLVNEILKRIKKKG